MRAGPAPGAGDGVPAAAREEGGNGQHLHFVQGTAKGIFNLLADGIVKLIGPSVRGSSVKGGANNWSDRSARRALLGEILADADWLLEVARQAQAGLPVDSEARRVFRMTAGRTCKGE